MSNQKIGIIPTFFLRGVSLQDIHNRYQQGEFKDFSPPLKKVNVNVVPINIAKSYSDDPSSGIYMTQMRNGIKQIVATTNQSTFEYFTKNGEKIAPGECDYCHQEIKGDPMGIPIKIEKKDSIGVVYCTHCTCSFECTLGLLKFINDRSIAFRNPIHASSEQLLRYIYQKAYPNAGILMEAPDYFLHKSNKGSLDDTDFHSQKHTYTQLPNLIFAPVKVPYVKS